MRVAALSLAGFPMKQLEDYAAALSMLLKKLHAKLVVLPAHTSFLLCAASGCLGETHGFADSYRCFMHNSREWSHRYLHLHSSLARRSNLYLVAGTTIEEVNEHFYHTSYCFGPDGEICGKQRQTHLSREERALGLNRGNELHLFDVAGIKAGLVVGTDALHPEVGRIFALEGADLVAHSGAFIAGRGNLVQPAGMWAQVQQNQFWAVEAQLSGSICDRTFGAQCAIIGPCEVTPGLSGYLDSEAVKKPFAVAELVEADLKRIKRDYPLLQLLNPKAYQGLLPELYK